MDWDRITVELERVPGGRWMATCPQKPGLMVSGSCWQVALDRFPLALSVLEDAEFEAALSSLPAPPQESGTGGAESNAHSAGVEPARSAGLYG